MTNVEVRCDRLGELFLQIVAFTRTAEQGRNVHGGRRDCRLQTATETPLHGAVERRINKATAAKARTASQHLCLNELAQTFIPWDKQKFRPWRVKAFRLVGTAVVVLSDRSISFYS